MDVRFEIESPTIRWWIPNGHNEVRGKIEKNSEIKRCRQLVRTCFLKIVFSGNVSPLIILNLVETRLNDNVPFAGSSFVNNMTWFHSNSFEFPWKHLMKVLPRVIRPKSTKDYGCTMQNLSLESKLPWTILSVTFEDGPLVIRPSKCFCFHKLRWIGCTLAEIPVNACKRVNKSLFLEFTVWWHNLRWDFFHQVWLFLSRLR